MLAATRLENDSACLYKFLTAKPLASDWVWDWKHKHNAFMKGKEYELEKGPRKILPVVTLADYTQDITRVALNIASMDAEVKRWVDDIKSYPLTPASTTKKQELDNELQKEKEQQQTLSSLLHEEERYNMYNLEVIEGFNRSSESSYIRRGEKLQECATKIADLERKINDFLETPGNYVPRREVYTLPYTNLDGLIKNVEAEPSQKPIKPAKAATEVIMTTKADAEVTRLKAAIEKAKDELKSWLKHKTDNIEAVKQYHLRVQASQTEYTALLLGLNQVFAPKKDVKPAAPTGHVAEYQAYSRASGTSGATYVAYEPKVAAVVAPVVAAPVAPAVAPVAAAAPTSTSAGAVAPAKKHKIEPKKVVEDPDQVYKKANKDTEPKYVNLMR